MGTKKTNPRKVPATQADVDKAYKDGCMEGLRIGLEITLHALMCDMELDEEFLIKFNHYYNVGLDSFTKKYIKRTDLIKNLMYERQLEVVTV